MGGTVMSVLGSFINLHTGSEFFFRGHCQRWDSWVTIYTLVGLHCPLEVHSSWSVWGTGLWTLGNTWVSCFFWFINLLSEKLYLVALIISHHVYWLFIFLLRWFSFPYCLPDIVLLSVLCSKNPLFPHFIICFLIL